jgi:hypothetical protein
MAKFTYNQDLENGLGDFQGSLDLHVAASGNKATWTDDVSGGQIAVEGKNLAAWVDDADYLGGGKITGAVMTDGDGKTIVSIADISLKATALMTAFQNGGTEGVIYFVTQGDDTVTGSKHGDYLVGGDGSDVMTGKAGSDMFEFSSEGGEAVRARDAEVIEHDVITDFDVKGGDADLLGLYQMFVVKSVHHGDDTRLDFDDGSTLVLEGVKKSAFEHYLDNLPEL